MKKYSKGVLEIAVAVIGASIIAAALLINKLNFSSPAAAETSCQSYVTQTSCSGSCSPTKRDGKSYACKWLTAQQKCVEASWECGGSTVGGVCPANTYKSECLDSFIGEHCANGKLCKTPIYDCYDNNSQPVGCNGGMAICTTNNGESLNRCNGTYAGAEICTEDSRCGTGVVRTASPRPTRSASPTPTRSPSPSPTPFFSPSSSPRAKATLRICKYEDKNGNGQIDDGEGQISWNFFVDYQGGSRKIGSDWWNLANRGCVSVDVPDGWWVRVYEEGRSGWTETGVYQDNSWVGTNDYNYIPTSGTEKKVVFLNQNTPQSTVSPTGTPNSCNGTCGSNYNCQGGFFCYIQSGQTSGYCRNPNCQTDSSCGCGVAATTRPTAPPVLGATAPPVLPRTGSNDWGIGLGLIGIMGGGFWLFKRFRLL